MKKISPFHLAIPVDDLTKAIDFYENILGFAPGRKSDQWADYNFFGHQLVVHFDPSHNSNKHHNKSLPKSLLCINCLKGEPVPETINGLLCFFDR